MEIDNFNATGVAVGPDKAHAPLSVDADAVLAPAAALQGFELVAIKGGIACLRWLLSYYRGNISFALAAYNAGEGRADRYKGIPPFPGTRDYVARVLPQYGRVVQAFDESIKAASPMLR